VATGPTEPARPTYQIEFAPSAIKQLEKLPKVMQRRIAAKIDALGREPRPHGVEKLEAREGLYRIRVGDYRVVYAIRDERLIVLILRIAHRKDVYRP